MRRSTCDEKTDKDRALDCTRRTSHVARFARHVARRTSHGFTLIELVVVLAILSLAALLIVPRLPSSDRAELHGSARNLATAIRYLQERGITGKELHRLRFGLSAGTLTVSRTGEKGEDQAPADPFLQRRLLRPGIVVEDVLIPRLGKIDRGEVTVPFGPAGLEEFLTVHLKGEGEERMTVAAFPAGGKVTILDGYREVTE